MKFVAYLNPAVKLTLQEAHKHHPSARFRQRAHALLLSHKGYTITQLTDIFDVHRDTVSQWLDDWKQFGLVGLHDKPKSGRPTLLTQSEAELFRGYIDENPHQPKSAIARLEEETGKAASDDTYKRVLKKICLSLETVAPIQQGETR